MTLRQTLTRSADLARLGLPILAGRRARRPADVAAARRRLVAHMGRLHGLPQKIGQILSLGELDDDGEESVYRTLTESRDATPARVAFGWIAAELGAPADTLFRSIDPQGSAASLGQVHRATLADGREVAVKVQYPWIRDTLSADLRALGWLVAPLTAHRRGFDLRRYRDEMRRLLLTELDYTREAETLRRYAAHRAEVPWLVTPDPIHGLCTSRLLTMTWVNGDPFERVREWPERDRREIGRQLVELFLRGALSWGELHADPHPGNLRFRRHRHGVEIGLLDFGCTQQLTSGARAALRRMLETGPTPAVPDLRATYAALGFDLDLLDPMLDRLGAVTQLLTEPFHTPGPFDLGAWRLSARLAEILGDDRWNFRFAGPATLIGFIRAFQGLTRYVSALGVPVDWHAVTTAVLHANPPATSSAMTEDPPMPPPSATTDAPSDSTALRIRVTRRGEQVVLLTFKPTLAAQLPDLIPEDLKPRLKAQHVDIAQLAARAKANGYPPGDLFTLDDGEKTVRVWLE